MKQQNGFKPTPKQMIANTGALAIMFTPPSFEFRRHHPLRSDGTLCFKDAVGYYAAALDQLPIQSVRALAKAVEAHLNDRNRMEPEPPVYLTPELLKLA